MIGEDITRPPTQLTQNFNPIEELDEEEKRGESPDLNRYQASRKSTEKMQKIMKSTMTSIHRAKQIFDRVEELSPDLKNSKRS